MLGTPKYMAPEQAAGRKDLTVAADVYSLGVILYERLTGQTPFTGDNALTLLRQARETEPPRPSSIRPGLDRDLETVVLKCLEKEPDRRYPSAEALADDLELAPPASRSRPGRSARSSGSGAWCRRNPLISGLTSAVAASLMIGIVASIHFAVQASRRALDEKRDRSARPRPKGAWTALARGLVRPIDPVGDYNATLSIPEIESLWELARLGNTNVGLRFLDEAARDLITTGQLRARSEPALIAAVGLDVEKRKRAARLLSERIRDPRFQLREKTNLAFVALESEDLSSTELNEACDILFQDLNRFPRPATEFVKAAGEGAITTRPEHERHNTRRGT